MATTTCTIANASGDLYQFRLRTPPVDCLDSVSTRTIHARRNEAGNLVVQLWPGATYAGRMGFGPWVCFTVPDAESFILPVFPSDRILQA